jgi:dolichol kinase
MREKVSHHPAHSEIARKLVHLLFGFLMIGIVFFGFYPEILLSCMLLVATIASVIIKKGKDRFSSYTLFTYYTTLERKKDLLRFPLKGIITFLIGTLLTVLLFERHVAIAALVILTIGDASAHIIGRYYGRIKIFNNLKNIEGTLIAILFCMLINFFLLHYLISFISAILALFVEAYEIKIGQHYLDDNIYLPVIAGIIITALEFLL